jgi:hypothetical protein
MGLSDGSVYDYCKTALQSGIDLLCQRAEKEWEWLRTYGIGVKDEVCETAAFTGDLAQMLFIYRENTPAGNRAGDLSRHWNEVVQQKGYLEGYWSILREIDGNLGQMWADANAGDPRANAKLTVSIVSALIGPKGANAATNAGKVVAQGERLAVAAQRTAFERAVAVIGRQVARDGAVVSRNGQIWLGQKRILSEASSLFLDEGEAALEGMARSKAIGNMGERIAERQFRDLGFEVVAWKAYVRTASGNRIPDLILRLPGDKRLIGVEVKANSGVRNAAQQAKDLFINEKGGLLHGTAARLADIAGQNLSYMIEWPVEIPGI